MCSTEITRRQTSYRCNSSPSHWVHEHCTTLRRNTDYTPTWKCNIHNQQNNTITDQHHQLTNNNNNMQQNLNINQPHSINNNKTQQQINAKKTIKIIQININGLTTKIHELNNLTDNTKIDIITIQEIKLKPTHRTPYLKDYTAIRTDRTYKNGGGLMTYIKNDIILTELKTPHTTNHKLTELQHIKIHLANHKHLNIFNIYIPPRDTTNPDHSNSQEDITNCMTHILNTNNTILTGDFNAHHTLWHSPTTDNRGNLIADLINSSNQIVLNTNTPTRITTNRNHQATSPDISTASNTIYHYITRSTLNALNSDHNSIKISYNTKTKFRLIQHRRSYTNYRKADWQGFTNCIENALTDTTDVTDVHKSNKILTLLLLDADKHFIPKGKIRPNNPLLPENIRSQIEVRDIIKANDPTDNRLEHLNKGISQAIQTHRSGIWKEHLDGHWDHRRNTHILWKTINGLSNNKKTPITNNTMTFKNYTAITPKQKANQFTKQFTNITKHKTKTHYGKLHRKMESLPTTPIKITIAQASAALKSTKNTNSTGPDRLNIRHLKHQLNINSITNKHEELKLLVTELQPDIITIQETKLKKHNKTPQIPTYSAIRTDRANGKGGGLLTYIKHNITFSDTKIPNFINPINTELQIIQLHITHKKIYTIANIYIPPRNTTSPDHATCDADITSCIQYITNLPNSIISGDINAHSPIWHSHTTDHRGDLIADLLGNSDHITQNTNTHTRLPFAANQRPTSPDITSITTNLYNRTHWETLNALNSDHLPILTTINTRTNFRLQQNRQTYTNYNKANWQNFTTET